MPFRKVENCNQVVKIGKQLKFSLVNIAGNDVVQGNKKLILGKPALLFSPLIPESEKHKLLWTNRFISRFSLLVAVNEM